MRMRKVRIPVHIRHRQQSGDIQAGWSASKFRPAQEALIKAGQIREFGFTDSSTKRDAPGVPIWEFAKKVNGGKHIENIAQETGDCVSFGMASVITYRSAYEIYWGGQEEVFKRAFPPYIYGISRTAEDCGNSSLWGAGSTGSWAATAVKNHGVLFWDEYEDGYSGSLADSWGSHRGGVPNEYQELARDNLINSAILLENVDQVREALINYCPCTIASNQGWNSTYEDNGYIIYKRVGRWAHQMCLLAWSDDNGGMAYQLNSWGPSHTPTPLNGEPPGGAWILGKDLETVMKSSSCEVYAVSKFDGLPGAANYMIC